MSKIRKNTKKFRNFLFFYFYFVALIEKMRYNDNMSAFIVADMQMQSDPFKDERG